MAIKSLGETFIYKHLNSSGAITRAISEIATNGEVITKSQLEEAVLIINKNFKFPMKIRTMQEFEEGKIKLLYGPKNVKLPTCMPFFLTKQGNDIVSCVMIDLYSSKNADGNVTIDPKKLYCLMESAMVAKILMTNPSVVNRPSIIKEGSEIYSAMFTRVLNKKYALNTDRNRLHKVVFLSSKFFLLNVLGQPDNDTTKNYAIRNCNNANPIILNELDEMFKLENYKDLSTFVQALSKEEYGLGLKDLTVRAFLEAYIHMYDASALLALEHIAYFLYNVFAVTNGAYINNQYILEDLIDKKGAKIYNDILFYLR